MKDRTNQEWLDELRGPDAAPAIADLRMILFRGLRAALSGRIRSDLESVLEDFTQDALLKVLDNLHTFRGESRLTTWAQKIAIHVAYSELRRRRWKDISLQSIIENPDGADFTPALLTDPNALPEKQASQNDLLAFVNRMIEEELTERQRTAIQAVIIGGMPIGEVAQRMETNSNALYKLIHDARKRLKARMIENGISPEDVLDAFS